MITRTLRCDRCLKLGAVEDQKTKETIEEQIPDLVEFGWVVVTLKHLCSGCAAPPKAWTIGDVMYD